MLVSAERIDSVLAALEGVLVAVRGILRAVEALLWVVVSFAGIAAVGSVVAGGILLWRYGASDGAVRARKRRGKRGAEEVQLARYETIFEGGREEEGDEG